MIFTRIIVLIKKIDSIFQDKPDTTSPYMKQLMEEARLETNSAEETEASSAPNGTAGADVFAEHGELTTRTVTCSEQST